MDAPQSGCSGSCHSPAWVVQSAQVLRRLSSCAKRVRSRTEYRTTAAALTRKPLLAVFLVLLLASLPQFPQSSAEVLQPSISTPTQLAQNELRSVIYIGRPQAAALTNMSALQEKQRKEMSDLQEKLRKEMANLQERQRRELSDLQGKQRKGLADLQEKQRKEMSELQEKLRRELSGLQENQRRELSQLQEKQRKETSELQERQRKLSTVQFPGSQTEQTKAGDHVPDTQLLSLIRQVREEWRQVSTQAQSTKYPNDNQRRDVFDRLLRANQSLKQAEAAAQQGDRVDGDQNVRRAQADLSVVAQRLKEIPDQVARSAPTSPSKDPSVLAGTVKEMLSQLAPGSEFVAGAEVTGELLNAAPPVLARKWNTMFEVANPGMQDPPQIDQVWAQNHRAPMIALYVALSRRQTLLEGGTTKVSAANFPQYQELITRARTLWP